MDELVIQAAAEEMMTTEERLAEIRARLNDLRVPIIEDESHYFHCERVAMEDVPWLLDLVDKQQEYVAYGVKSVRELQERVRELEAELNVERNLD